MQSVLGASAAEAFSLIWGNVGISYYSLLHLTREKLMGFRGHLTYLSSMPVQSLLISPTAGLDMLSLDLILTLLRIFLIMIHSCFLIEIVP